MTTVDFPVSAMPGTNPSNASEVLEGGRVFKKQLSNSSSAADEAREAAMGPYQRQASAGVSQELRNRLASVGMHARFNVNRGYASPPIGLSPACSSMDPFGTNNLNSLAGATGAPIFASSRDTAQAVSRTRSKWSRTSSAPSTSMRELQPYGGSVKLGCLSSAGEEDDDEDGFDPRVLESRPDGFVGASGASGVLQPLQAQALDSPSSATFGLDLKRARDDVLGLFMDEDEDEEMGAGVASPPSSARLRPVQPLPFRRTAGLGGRTAASAGFSRGATGASTMPVGSSRMADFIDAQREDQGGSAEWEQHDFSTAAQGMEEF